MSLRLRFLLFVLFTLTLNVSAQPPQSQPQPQSPERAKLLESLEKEGCVTIEKVRMCKYDYTVNGTNLEAISFRPVADGRYPAVLLVPGYQRTAPDFIFLGRALGDEGYASLAITQPGFGKSNGKADYVGPGTIEALTIGFNKFRGESYVDSGRMAVFGYSRGGMAASLLALKLKDIKAAVLGAGVYDFKKAYDEMKIEGIRENMRLETGMTEQAIKERSSILRMNELKVPLLILHGEKDVNVPVSQATALRDRLTELKKDFEIKLYPDAEHSIPRSQMMPVLLDFLNRRVKEAK